jgi:TonB-dependent receptor
MAFAVGLTFPNIAVAQQASPSSVTPSGDAEIVVTGVRASVQNAERRKRDASSIVDSIVAEDIGKLPDNNVAEALQRVSGVQITRDSGQGTGIAIRGLSQVQTLLDGRQVFTGSSRSLSVADIPAELIAGIDVHKTVEPQLIEGGLGGTVDIRTRHPLDFDGLEVSGTVRGEYSDMRDKVKPYVSGLISDRWSTGIGEVGALVSASYQDFVYRADRNATGTYLERTDLYDRDGDGVFPDDPDDLIVSPTDVGERYTYGERKRLGVNGSLQWKPSDNLEFHLDGIYTHYDGAENNQLIYARTGTSGLRDSDAVAVGPFDFAKDGLTVARGTWENALINPSTYINNGKSETYQIALGGKWTGTNAWLSGEVSYNKSTSQGSFGELMTRANATRYSADLTHELPRISIEGFDPNDLGAYTLQQLGYSDSHDAGREWAGRVDAHFDVADEGLTAIQFGVRYADRSARSRSRDQTLHFEDGVAASDYADLFQLTDDDLFGNDALGKTLGVRQWITPRPDIYGDPLALRQQLGFSDPLPEYSPLNRYRFSETTLAGYMRADFAFGLAGLPVDGNVGIRVIRTDDIGRSAVTAPDGGTAPLTQSNSYVSALPSANVRFKFTPNLFLRLAASKSLTRPSFGSLNPALHLDYSFLTGSAGNPGLEPLRADQYDASLEWYVPGGGLLYGAVFYKKVDGFVQNIIAPEVHEGQTFLVSRPRNGEDGKIKGFEIGAQKFFDFLPAPFDGFGVQANYTYVDSKAPSGIVGQTVPLENLSKNSYNLIGLYEKYGLSVRVAYNWRSAYVNTTGGGQAGGLPIYTAAIPQLDASVNYDLTDHITLTADAQGLTRHNFIDYYGYTYRPKANKIYDRRFQFGVRFRF